MTGSGSKKVKAIVTRAVPYRETDMIVTLVSAEEGRITASARGCLKQGAKLRYAAEPFNFGDYLLSGRGDRYIITECSQIECFSPLTCDLENYYTAAFIVEALEKLSREAQPELLAAAVRCLNALAYEGADAQETATAFLMNILALNGESMSFVNCASCGCVLDRACAYSHSDGIVCRDCAPPDALSVQKEVRTYLAGEESAHTAQLKLKANILLIDIVYITLGIKISKHYFTEQL